MARIRGELQTPFEGYPALGAFHEIVPNRSLDRFMSQFCQVADEVLMGRLGSEEVDNAGHIEPEEEFDAIEVVPPEGEIEEYDPHDYYRAYYSTSMWVSVLDGNQSERHARAVRKIWEKQDLGDTQQLARNEIDKRMPDGEPCLMLDQVVRVGRRLPSAPSSHEGRKLAFVPNPAECVSTQALLAEENGIIIEAIQRRMKKFVPLGEYVPHVTFAWFTDRVDEDQLSMIAQKAKELAEENPVHVQLERQVSFRDRLVR